MKSQQLGAFVRQNWKLVTVFLIASVAALWFAGSILLQFLYFNDPRHQDEALKGWMTARYIVLSYDLPRPLVLEALDLSPEEGGRRPLRKVAQEMGITLDELTQIVRNVAQEHRQDRP